jgi:hypothetical protein
MNRKPIIAIALAGLLGGCQAVDRFTAADTNLAAQAATASAKAGNIAATERATCWSGIAAPMTVAGNAPAGTQGLATTTELGLELMDMARGPCASTIAAALLLKNQVKGAVLSLIVPGF